MKISNQKRGFLNFLRSLMCVGLPLMKNGLTPSAKSILTSLKLTAASSVTDATIQKKIFVSGTTALTISNEEMDDIMKVVKFLEESRLLLKGKKSKIIKNEAKEQKSGFPGMLLGILAYWKICEQANQKYLDQE